MEPIFLTCMVIAYFFTKGKVDTAAYASGKESPGVAKARLRHEGGGGGRSTSGRPKGKGAFRLALADRWAHACEASRQRGEHKAQRRRAWYAETAPQRDEKWREKKLQRLKNAEEARNKWAAGRGLIDLDNIRKPKNESPDAVTGQPDPGTSPDHDPLHPTDAAHLAWYARQNPDVARAAEDRARVFGVRDGALWYDAVREAEARDAAAKLAATDPEAAATAADPATLGTMPADGTTPDQAESAKPEESTADATTDAGCRWIPSGKSEACGQRRRGDSPYCAEHYLVGRLTECSWSRDNRGEPQCPNERAAHQSYCEAHLAEHAKRTEAINGTSEEPDPAETAPDTTAGTPATAETPATNKTEGTTNVYQQAVTRLIAAADDVAEFRADLAAFADNLGGKKWGVEVTGPISDMDGQLAALEGDYRDLAGQMKHQGDQGAAAHEQAPWVPADDSILV